MKTRSKHVSALLLHLAANEHPASLAWLIFQRPEGLKHPTPYLSNRRSSLARHGHGTNQVDKS